jgi:hypothetical protein
MIKIITLLFLTFLFVNLSNTVWVRDEFLFCEQNELIFNEEAFCEYAFLPIGIKKCLDKLKQLLNNQDEYYILNEEKRVVVYSDNKQLFNSSCQLVSGFYVIDTPDCVKGVFGNFSLNNKLINGFIHGNGIVVVETDINDKYCATNFEYTGLNKKVLIRKSLNLIEIINKPQTNFLSNVSDIKYLVCGFVLMILFSIKYLCNNRYLMILVRKILKLMKGEDRDDFTEVVVEQSINGIIFIFKLILLLNHFLEFQ